MQRFALLASLLELCFTRRTFREDEYIASQLVGILLEEKNHPTVGQVKTMDILFTDLMREAGPPEALFFVVPYRLKKKGAFPRSLCLFHLDMLSHYEPIFRHEGETQVTQRILNRAAKIHEIAFDTQLTSYEDWKGVKK